VSLSIHLNESEACKDTVVVITCFCWDDGAKAQHKKREESLQYIISVAENTCRTFAHTITGETTN
jgi:hypothetical protein